MSDEDEDEDIDTDLETDRLLGHQMQDDGFYEDKAWVEKNTKSLLNSTLTSRTSPKMKRSSTISKSNSSATLRHGLNALLPTSSSSDYCNNNNNCSPSILPLSTAYHQNRSLKTSPSLKSSNLLNMINPNNEVLSDSQSENVLQKMAETQDGQRVVRNEAESIELCNLNHELVDSPGGSSSDKSKKDITVGAEIKKKNKNKEGEFESNLPYRILTLK